MRGDAVTILGGGPAGLAVGHYASRAGLPFVLYERAGTLGGLCRTLACGPHRYDTGAHRFHDRHPGVTSDVRALLGPELRVVDAPSRILHDGRFLDFPPRPLGWVLARGPLDAARTFADLVRARRRPRPERTFADHALNRYGPRLARPLLLDYSEKLWGLPADALAPDVATRRLSGLTLRALVVELLRPRRATAHLDGAFLYPRDGYGAIADALAGTLPAERVRLGHEVTGLDCDGGRIRAIRFADRPPAAVTGPVVATLPLPHLVRWLGAAVPATAHAAAARLRFRHVRLVFLRVAARRCSPNATVYLPDPRLCVTRVSEPKNRSAAMAPPDETGLLAEVPCSDGDAVARLDDAALAARVVGELAGVGLVAAGAVLEWRHHRLRHAYPVYGLDWAPSVETVMDGLDPIANLHLLGRAGRFWYSHLHDQLHAARAWVASAVERAAEEHVAAHPQVGAQAVVGAPAA